MNILKRIFTLFLSFLSRVHLVRRKDKFVITCKTTRTRSGLYDHCSLEQKGDPLREMDSQDSVFSDDRVGR